MSKGSRVLASACALAVLAASGNALEWPGLLVHQKDGGMGDQLGFSVARAGDVNGDGLADFIAGAHLADAGGLLDAGSAYVYSGADGSVLFHKDGAVTDDNFGWSVGGAGDVNRDGFDDFIVGAPFAGPGGAFLAGSVYVYSGADGGLLYQKDGAAIGDNFGYAVAGAGDMNGDGWGDFLVGAPFSDPQDRGSAGTIYVYSGFDGGVLFLRNGAEAGDRMGSAVAGTGDVNGDGRDDFIVGAPGGIVSAGKAYVFSGYGTFVIFRKVGEKEGYRLGNSVAGAGDVDGDGERDFIVGAHIASADGFLETGSAFVYSGYDGNLIYRKDGAAAGDRLGSSVAGVGDVNGDGRDDFVVGAYFADPGNVGRAGSAYLYSGVDGSLLFQKDGLDFDARLGYSVAALGDLDRDGKAEFVIGAPAAHSGGLDDAGQVFVYSLPCAALRGDLNADGVLNLTDVLLEANCVFLEEGSCNLCLADGNCDGFLTPSDVIVEIFGFFAGRPITCTLREVAALEDIYSF